MEKLRHRTVYEDKTRIATSLPFIPELQAFHENGSFPLVADPKKEGKASIIGMFVIRPAQESWNQPLVDANGRALSMYSVRDWAFNLKGLDGGWLIAAGNVLDAYRLALQYGLADAVMVGSTTVAKEGVDKEGGHRGYLWQPYGPLEWEHLAAAHTGLLPLILKQRAAWQAMGYLSSRQYPAQIVITQSGEHRAGTRDVLEARVFTEKHPDGSPIEAYILTSERGAERIRARAGQYGLDDRIDDILITLSPAGEPEKLDIPRVPSVLHDSYGVRIINHDGGQTVLSEFSKAGVLSQINLTLGRKQSVYDVLAHSPRLAKEERAQAAASFAQNIQYFFSGDHGLPQSLRPASILTDEAEDVAVIAFDARNMRGL